MPRTRNVTWTYECEAPAGPDDLWTCQASLDVTLGDRCSTGRGTVVNDQADADAVARQIGWTVGRRVICPHHAGGAS